MAQIAEAHPEMPVSDLAAIHIGLARFAGAVFPDNLEHIDAVLAACAEVRHCCSLLHSCSLLTAVFLPVCNCANPLCCRR